MKKLNFYFLISIPLLLASCSDDISPSDSIAPSEEVKEPIFEDEMYYKEEAINPYYFDDVSKYKLTQDEIDLNFEEKYFDNVNNLTSSNATYGELYLNGKLNKNISEGYATNDDANYIFYGDNKARVIQRSKGYAFTLPTSTILKPDLRFNNYRSKFINKDYEITVSEEHGNPYGSWDTYHDEWITRYLTGKGMESWRIERFMKNNNLSYTKAPYISNTLLKGYESEVISILINDNENIEKPYYNIAIIRKPSSIKNFTLFVMKSKNDMTTDFENIVRSYSPIRRYGRSIKGEKIELKVPSYLNEETQKYYKLLLNQNYTGWGIFNHSMYVNGTNEPKIANKNREYGEMMNYNFDILPTYTHIGERGSKECFPVKSATHLAGGNGFNDKPVIQFTLQFTSSNNQSLHDYTPMYDILRGKYDDYFKELAKGMKEYKAPILFRVNNEMNSDWVSYCGQVTLLDPDIFQMTWERMANILKDEGVDNVLYIFNPTAKSYPFSSWGEDMCYLPSMEFVNILGLTSYEYNNYFDEDPIPFFTLYKDLYEKNMPYWEDYPAIISEFACGAGGNYPEGKLYRNAMSQAVWVEEMLDLLNNAREQYPFINQIKGAIWFNAHDEVGAKIKNNLIIDNVHTPTTIEAFKYGLSETNKIKEITKKGNQ